MSGSINAALVVTPQSSPICSGNSTNIQVAASQVGVNYQLRNNSNNALIGPTASGTGAAINLPTGNLAATITFNILASNGTCSIQLNSLATVTVNINPNPNLATAASINPVCTGGSSTITVSTSEVGVNYQLRDAGNAAIGASVAGTGATISLPTGALAANATFNVFASSGVCASVQLTNTVSITVGGSLNTGLPIAPQSPTICSGTATNIQISNSEVGVTYQLRNNSNNAVIGANVSGTGATINLPTGNLTANTTFNILASNGVCSTLMSTLPSVTVNAQPAIGLAVTAQNAAVCTGTATNIQVATSEVGVSYQLRNNTGNVLVGVAISGTGGTINLPTGNLIATTTFNVFASSGGSCTAQLTATITVNVLLASDPLCTGGTGTCATVVITPKPSPATCTNSNGKIIMSIKPFVPAVNPNGVKISIKGISSTNLTIARTNFNDSTFLNLPIGVYSFKIAYGDSTVCVKTGQVTVDQSGTVGTPIASNVSNATCYGSATGSLKLDVPGETGNLLQWSVDGINWNNFTAGSQITGVPAGTAPLFNQVISVRRNSSDPCNAAVTVVISQPADITSTFTITDASCNNNDGKILVVTITGGTSPYTFRLDSAAYASLPANSTFTGLSGGLHKFTVIDANGCTKYFKLLINFPGLVNFTTLVSSPSCTGSGNDASVVATITSSGTFNIGITTDPANDPTVFQTVVSAGNAPATFSGLSQGTYYVVAKPVGALCPTRTLVTVNGGPVAINFNFIAKNFICFETLGTLKVYGIKGSPAVSYGYEVIHQGNVVQSGAITQTQALDTVNILNLSSGSLQVHLFQDQSVSSGCATPISSAYQSFVITGPTASLDTLFVARTSSLPNLPSGSMLIGIKESNEQPYQLKLQLITPFIQGQKNRNTFDSVWVTVPRNNQNQIVELNAANLYPGDYRLSIRDTLGCAKTYSLVLNTTSGIFIPNIFTPNNDGKNDTFEIINLPSAAPNQATMIIANRWGKQVFESNSYGYNNSWWNGGAEADGIYYYRLSAGGKSYTGWVEILHPSY